ncbi:hypothetical protein Tco_0424791 [Tanacetum coccineum]
MLESEAYMTYHAYATGEKTLKPKTTKKKADSESSLKMKSTQASKGKRITTLAKGDKPAKKKQSITKSKGLTVLSEVTLTEAQQMKIVIERIKIQTHSSHASGSSDGVDIQSKVPDESESKEESWTYSQGEDDEDNDEHDSENDNDDEDDDQENVSGETESDNDGDDFMVSTPPDYEITEEEENQEDDDNVMGGEQEDEEDEELYGDLNLNLERRDAKMTDAQVNQEKEEVHVTFTTELPVVQQQSSSVSSDLVSKFMNPTPDTGIDSILNLNIQSDIPVNVSVSVTTTTPSSDTTIPQTPIPIIQPQQQTHDSTTTTTIPATTLPNIPNFASLFGFERRVSSLETELSELKQTNQFAEAVSSIPGIVDNYLASKMKDEVNVAIQLKSNKLREEAQAENEEFLNQIESNIKAIIKDQVKAQVKAQVSKILPKVEKFVTESLGAEVLARSSNQPQTSYAAAASLSEFELKKILIDKIDENKSMNRSDVQKNLYNALIESYNSDKDLFASYGKEESSKEATQKESKSTSSSKGATRSQPKSSGKSAQAEEHGPRVDDLEEPSHQEFETGNDDISPARELAQASSTQSSFNEFLATPIDFFAFIMNRININNLTQDVLTGPTSLTKTKAADYSHVKLIEDKVPRNSMDMLPTWKLQKMSTQDTGSLLLPVSRSWSSLVTNIWKRLLFEGRMISYTGKLTNLNLDERFELNVTLRMYTRYIVIQERVEDLQLAVESYQKKINLSRPDSYCSDLRKMTPYTAYHDIQGIIYQDDMDRNRLMRTDELHKFSDGTLNHVCTTLNDIATGIQMEYLPKRKWSKQDKQRARVMINAIDKKLRDRRLMRSLEKFIGRRPYRGDLQLLQRTI